MRSFAEEKKGGTMELLLTKPLTDWDILLGKFLASFLLVMFALLPTVIYYISLHRLGNPVGNIDTPGVIGSYFGLVFLGGIFCAIGIMTSSVTPNQIVSFIVSAFLCFILFTGFDSIATLDLFSNHALVIRQIGIAYHYESISRGMLDIRDVVYFVSVTWLILFITRIILKSRSW
jgi:ABC-2 type transport system permease protein